MKNQILKLSLAFTMLMITACGSLKTAIYDQYSYQQEVDIKVETQNLLKHATQPYSNYATDVDKLLL